MKDQPKIRSILVEDMKVQREHYAELINSHQNFEIVRTYDRLPSLQDLENDNIQLIWQDDDIRGTPTALALAAMLQDRNFPKVIILTEGNHPPTIGGAWEYTDVILKYQRKKDFDSEMLDRIYNDIILPRLNSNPNRLNNINEYIDIRINENDERQIRRVPIKNIIGFTSSETRNCITIYLQDNDNTTIETRFTLERLLNEINNRLPENKKDFFKRLNNSWVVNRFHINRFDRNNCIWINLSGRHTSIGVSPNLCDIPVPNLLLGGGLVEW